jgi:serine/threonine protein kinase
MNYEEKLEAREGINGPSELLPIGTLYKKLIDRKYHQVVEVRRDLTDSIVFSEALKADSDMMATFTHPHQLHFKTQIREDHVIELELETGNFQTYHQLLTHNPAVVASKNYIETVVELMANMLKELHSMGVYQCCLAPQFLIVRKGDDKPMLFLHGSFYKGMNDKSMLYKGFEDYVAPEVMANKEFDERADVYALGKLIQRLYADGSMSFDFKQAVAMATNEDPEQRFATIDLMLDAINKKRSMRRSVMALVGALLIGGLCIGLYMDLMPEPVDVEFVKPAIEETIDPYEVGLTPAEMGLDDNDTIYMDEGQRFEQEELDKEIERIFRRHFAREAEGVLSKIYSKENMNSSEQAFINSGNAMMDELYRKRDELATQSGMPAEKANEIATEIINKLREEKQKNLKSFGYQPNKKVDSED